MNPGSKGWLKDYLEFRQEPMVEIIAEGRKASHPDHSLYRALQPNGLMYGQAVKSFIPPQNDKWSEKEIMKILLADSLISSSLLFHNKVISNTEELSALTLKTLEDVANFYNHVFPEVATPTKTLFGKRKTAFEQVEKILEKRIEQTIEFKDNFWTQLFQNSLLFLDVFIFGQWIHTNADKIVSDFFKYERDELRTSVVKVMAAAAHANHVVEFEERKLMEYFLDSAQLSHTKRRECQDIFEKGISIEEINLPTNNSWLLKKYFLETAILTVWADKKVEESEMDFIQRFADTLSFSQDELEHSMIAVEGFILEHWLELSHLQDHKDYDLVKERFISRILKVTEKHKSRLTKAVKERGDLMLLLKNSQKQELTDAAKLQLRQYLTEVLKEIPAFSIIALPKRFLSLPVLIQVFPKNFIAECLTS